MKNIKRILCICLTVCICLCAVSCNKVNDNNSSGFSSTATQTGTISIDSQIEITEENTSTEENKVGKEDKTDAAESKTNKEESKEEITASVENNVIPSVPEDTSNSNAVSSVPEDTSNSNAVSGLTWEIYKKLYLPDWASEYPTSEIVDWSTYYTFDYGITLIITKEKELYLLADRKSFSDGTHFKKIESELKFEKILPPASILTTDGKIFDISYNGELNLNDDYKGKQFHYRNNSILTPNNKIVYSFPQDENVISINSQNIVQTTKGFYKIIISTEQEFVDSEPKTVIEAKFICAQLEEMFIKYYLYYEGRG